MPIFSFIFIPTLWSAEAIRSLRLFRTKNTWWCSLNFEWPQISSGHQDFSSQSQFLSLLFYSFESFSHQCLMMVSHWSLNDSKSLQFSWILLSIRVDLNNAVVSTCPLISWSSNPCISHLVTVSSGPITNGITITFMFHGFVCSLARSWYLSFFFFSLSFSFTLWSVGTAKPTFMQVLSFEYLLVWSSGRD